ncbi:MAG: disulfide bond formation protein B, partial [Pseudomonadota bacterium]
ATPPHRMMAALRVLGLSFAGWNVIASAVLAWAAFKVSTRD